MYQKLLDELGRSLLIPVVTIDNLDNVLPLVQTLQKAGIKFLEITYRNGQAGKALQLLSKHDFGIILGAGTIRTLDQAQDAIQNGVQFIVSPGFNREIVQYAKQRDIPIIPGIDSTLGIEMAISEGLKTLKFFPAGVSGGVKWLKSIMGPYFNISFIPTGGISLENLSDYAKLSNVVGIGGSFLAPKTLITQKNWDGISNICTKALEIVDDVRESGRK
ncbi:MAG: bifunctional 4-hydroxy-2-oxoglutarate aldolase/2-dehydro-3-deoxy-phosphogluconate aldolase [Promethearchaeota archaeon]